MQRHDFELSGEYIQLNKLLKFVGVCDSGGSGKALVASGVVTVDGLTELRKTAKIRAGQRVAVGDIVICVRRHDEAPLQAPPPPGGEEER